MLSYFPFLATDLPPLSKEEWQGALFTALVLGAIATMFSIFWRNTRREPSLEKEIDQKIALSSSDLERRIDGKLDDLKTQMRDLKSQIRERDDSIDKIKSSLEKGFSDLNRSIGRIEGKLEGKPA